MSTLPENKYSGASRLMANYGWVQNTSNLSTVRDTVGLVPESGISHNALMRSIYESRTKKGEIINKWTWDARCRIKAICACGMVELDRELQGYRLTELGKELCSAPKSAVMNRGKRLLSPQEVEIFRRGLLTNPPVIRVLSLLNENRRKGLDGLSKYDIGGQLGFAGDIGFTHLDATYVARSGKNFNDAEGDADKWARTIISWLTQVNWVFRSGTSYVFEKMLPIYSTTSEVDRVLQYTARSTVKYIPQEMLCSDHHPFAPVVQHRRISLLRVLQKTPMVKMSDLLNKVKELGSETDEETLSFDILNLFQAGIQVVKEQSFCRLMDKIKLDIPTTESRITAQQKVEGIEKEIEHYVMIYSDSLPSKLVDNLIRYGYDGANGAALFESAVGRMFEIMGYETDYLGQGYGRVADIIAKYRDLLDAKSYGLIIDAKAYTNYTFPAGDVRKMKEYIILHGKELMKDMIPHYAFAFVSMAFASSDEHLSEIARDTAVNGTAIDVYELMELGSKVLKQEMSIASLLPLFTTNKPFKCQILS